MMGIRSRLERARWWLIWRLLGNEPYMQHVRIERHDGLTITDVHLKNVIVPELAGEAVKISALREDIGVGLKIEVGAR